MSRRSHMNEWCHTYEWVMSPPQEIVAEPVCHIRDLLESKQDPDHERMEIRRILYENLPYGVATISRLHKSIGLFCKRAL